METPAKTRVRAIRKGNLSKVVSPGAVAGAKRKIKSLKAEAPVAHLVGLDLQKQNLGQLKRKKTMNIT